MDVEANIIAIASPPGRGVRGVIRLSGPTVVAWLAPHVTLDTGALAEPPERGMVDATLTVLPTPLRCRIMSMPGPRSYTGQDVLELFVPGHPTLLTRIVDGLLAHGGRHAEAGEFTARAFLTGRLSLAEAEGVAATIEARSDAELRAARMLTGGRLGGLAASLADEIARLLALVEAGIDFTDQEDVVPIAPVELDRALVDLMARLDDHLARATGLETLSALPWVVITGPPNAGKSTLFNTLLGGERAVVSAAAGTTRDVLAEALTIETDHGPAEVMLVDIAGEEAAFDTLSRKMQAAADDARARAELTIACVAPGQATSHAPAPETAQTLVVYTKADVQPPPAGAHAVSAVTGTGLPTLRDQIAARLGDRAVSLAADSVALAPRHETALRAARAALAEARDHVDRRAATFRSPELAAQALRQALDQVGAIAGAVTPDDVLGKIFATFCVGK